MDYATTVTSELLHSLLAEAAREEIATEALLARRGLLESWAAVPNARVPRDAFLRLWTDVAERSSHASFGLRVAEATEGRIFGVAGLYARNAASLETGLRRVAELSALVDQAAAIRLDVQPGGAAVVSAGPLDGASWPGDFAEMMIASLRLLSARWTGTAVAPIAIRFQHRRSRASGALERFFGCPVSFGCATNQLVLSPSRIAQESKPADPVVERYFALEAERCLSSLSHGGGFELALRRSIEAALAEGPARLGPIARGAGITPRTLQRRLRELGTTFAELVDAVRRAAALRALASQQVSVSTAARATGFADIKAFRLAFRRWTGTTPRAYRALRAKHPPIRRTA